MKADGACVKRTFNSEHLNMTYSKPLRLAKLRTAMSFEMAIAFVKSLFIALNKMQLSFSFINTP